MKKSCFQLVTTKRVLMVTGIVLSMSFCLSAQSSQIVVQQNPTQVSSINDGSVYINGVSTRESIGGVEVSRGEFKGYEGNYGKYHLKFTNYNSIPVSIIYQLLDDKRGEITGTIVLQAAQVKSTDDTYANPVYYKLIVRPVSGGVTQTHQNQASGYSAPTINHSNSYNPSLSSGKGNFLIGVVDTRTVIEAMDEYKRASRELESYSARLQSEVNDLQSKSVEDVQRKIQERTEQLLVPVQKKILNAIEKICYEEGLVIIFENTIPIAINTSYCIDITNAVIKMLQ